MTSSFRVEVGRAVLHGDAAGDGAPLLLLHAGVADRRSWAPLRRSLSSNYRVAAYDRRGFGTTVYEAEPHSDVGDLAAVLDALDLERAVLVGNSQGGRLAIDFALEHPTRVSRLILLAPAVSGEPDPESLPPPTATIDAAIEAADEAGDIDTVNELEAHFWLDGPRCERGRVGGAARELFLDMNGIALAAADLGERKPRDAYSRLGELSVPVDVMVGELDLECVIERAREIAALVPVASLTVLPGVAHLPQLEDADAFNAAFAAVLNGRGAVD